MKKMTLAMLAGTGLAAVALTGCTATETNRVGEQVQIVMPLQVKPTVEAKTELVTGEATVHGLFGIFSWGVSEQAVGVNFGGQEEMSFFVSPSGVAKNGAVYNACTQNDADLLIAPQYVLKISDYFFYKQIKCTVKGYPATLKGVKVMN